MKKIQKKPYIRCAIVYDFDGTLANGACVEHGLMQEIGIDDINKFWKEVKSLTKERDADEILTYLGLLALKARLVKKRELLYPNSLKKFGKKIKLFHGVKDWFVSINDYGRKNGLEIDHYIISSGLYEMILGTPIAKYFKEIFACKYHYDEKLGYAKWLAVAINYTTKTQYLFRINKGITNCWDNESLNKYTEPKNRSMPFEKMIYVGDGDTDIPSMKLVKGQGGHSIAVFDNNKWKDSKTQEKIEKLISEDRVNYVAPADYNESSQLYVTIRGLLQMLKRKYV